MKLAVVGVGKMGEAILEGMLNASLLERSEIGVVGGRSRRAAEVAELHGVNLISRAQLQDAERVLICVQPKVFPQIAGEIADLGFEQAQLVTPPMARAEVA